MKERIVEGRGCDVDNGYCSVRVVSRIRVVDWLIFSSLGECEKKDREIRSRLLVGSENTGKDIRG